MSTRLLPTGAVIDLHLYSHTHRKQRQARVQDPEPAQRNRLKG